MKKGAITAVIVILCILLSAAEAWAVSALLRQLLHYTPGPPLSADRVTGLLRMQFIVTNLFLMYSIYEHRTLTGNTSILRNIVPLILLIGLIAGGCLMTFDEYKDTAERLYILVGTVVAGIWCLSSLMVALILDYDTNRLLRLRDMLDTRDFLNLENKRLQAESLESQRIRIHDINRNLSVLQTYLSQEQYGEAREYLEEMLGESTLTKSEYCADDGLNMLAAMLDDRCRREGIDCQIEILGIPDRFMEPLDTAAVFGNLFDNALEAAARCADPVIRIRIEGREIKQGLEVHALMENRAESAPLLDGQGLPVSSRKGEGVHGYGLRSVSRVLRRYHGRVAYQYDPDENMIRVRLDMLIRK